jgi:hypothetical protein
MSDPQVPRGVPIGPISVTINGRPARAATSATVVRSPYVVALQTSISDARLRFQLHSIYIGVADGDTQATHLMHAPAQGVRIETVVAAAGVMPVPRHRDAAARRPSTRERAAR